MNSSKFTIIILITIVLGLSAYLIWEKLDPGTGTVDIELQLRDSIALIEKQRIELELKIDSLNRSYDSLLSLKQEIKIRYVKKIEYIYSADPNQLDSIISSAIKP